MDPLVALLMKKYGFDEKGAAAYAQQVKAGKATASKQLIGESMLPGIKDQHQMMSDMRRYASATDPNSESTPDARDRAFVRHYEAAQAGRMRAEAAHMAEQDATRRQGLADQAIGITDRLGEYANVLHDTARPPPNLDMGDVQVRSAPAQPAIPQSTMDILTQMGVQPGAAQAANAQEALRRRMLLAGQ